MAEYVLPPLKPRPTYHWFEANLLTWREAVAKKRAASKSHFGRAGFAIVSFTLWLELRSGRKVPWLIRFWYAIGRVIMSGFGDRRRRQPALIRKAFDPGKDDTKFHAAYVMSNFLTNLCILWFVAVLVPYGIEGAYIWGSYHHDKYTNVKINSHYRDFDAGAHIFSIHGTYQLDGKTEELFIQIGPSYWFQEYNPENIFGKISDNALCNFDAYGWLIRIPLGVRYLSGGSLYALTPWAVNATCHTPSDN